MQRTGHTTRMPSVVIPAHNEENGIGRLLRALGCPDPVPFEVVVVANGCSDSTARIARELGATVVETPVPSKVKALALGDTQALSFPRLYVDGDVVLHRADVTTLCQALADGVLAAGPERVLPMDGVSRVVRWYYSVWQELDGVQNELYGRGAIAIGEAGHQRLRDWPDVMSDDMFVAMSFAPHERRVVADAKVVILPPKTYGDLLRRRVRVMAGNAQATSDRHLPFVRPSGASLRYFGRLVLQRPRCVPQVAVFVGTAALARLWSFLAIRRGTVSWLRDESSRR